MYVRFAFQPRKATLTAYRTLMEQAVAKERMTVSAYLSTAAGA